MISEKSIKKTIITLCVILSAAFLTLLCTCVYHLFPSMDNIPEGEFISSSQSPDGAYKVYAYLCSGNATTDFAVRCEAVELSTGEKRNIYWNYHCETADIEWSDEKTVEINGQVLNVISDSYDWRSNA